MTDIIAALRQTLADRYTIERELGAGGMATVYLAHDVRHDRKVALKVLRPELSAILGAERFLAEIKTTANLQHPHILSLFDSGEAGGFVFYVMPFVEGESLRDRLNRDHQLPVDEAVRITREVAGALEYAHQHGIVHRDIKPENILLHGGHAVVADFGIALAASRSDGSTRMTETGMSLGTPHYMSPEQAMGEREITPKADIYALGCVLYEMLTAEPPFVGPSAQAIIGRVLTEEPRSLTKQRKTIPPNVDAAVQIALAKLPADRFASAKEFGDALAKSDFAIMSSRTIVETPGPMSGSRVRVAQLAPWGIAAIAALVALGVWLRPLPPPEVSRQYVRLSPFPMAVRSMAVGVAISPDGRTIVYADTVGGTRQLWAKERDRLEATPLTGSADALGPTFSPDGQSIAFEAGGKVKRIPRLGGSPVTIADSANPELPAIAWLDDGTLVYNTSGYGTRTTHMDGGPAVAVPSVDSTRLGLVAATPLPGGRGALLTLCTSGCVESELHALDLRTGRLSSLGSEIGKGWYLQNGDVVFVRRDGGVFRAPFDLESMSFRAPPVPVLEGVRSTVAIADMALAPNGTLLYVAGPSVADTRVEVVWVTREGLVSPVDSGWSFDPVPDAGLAISPTGDRLAVAARASGGNDIWIKQLPRGSFTRLTFQGTNRRPFWAPNGRSLFYLNQRDGAGYALTEQRADGSGSPITILAAQRSIDGAARTRDTMRFVVRLGGPPSHDLHVLTRTKDSAATTPLVAADGFDERTPTISPDGRYLAYTSNESGAWEVYVRPYPDANGGRWQVSRTGGQEPRWAHSGRELFYRDRARNLVAASVTLGATFVLGEQRNLFSSAAFNLSTSHPQWDVAPDDRRFVFLRRVGVTNSATSDPMTVILVENWITELNAGAAKK